jgi:hypothetical protein
LLLELGFAFEALDYFLSIGIVLLAVLQQQLLHRCAEYCQKHTN